MYKFTKCIGKNDCKCKAHARHSMVECINEILNLNPSSAGFGMQDTFTPQSTVQEAVAPSLCDGKAVDWDVLCGYVCFVGLACKTHLLHKVLSRKLWLPPCVTEKLLTGMFCVGVFVLWVWHARHIYSTKYCPGSCGSLPV